MLVVSCSLKHGVVTRLVRRAGFIV